MAENKDGKERRKYPRVLLELSSKVLSIEIVGYGETLIFDMSYQGAAFSQPKDRRIEDVDLTVALQINAEGETASIEARTVRVSDDVVAVHFEEISVEARMIIDRVVTDRIVGLNMVLIDSKHYAGKDDFTSWFHGPKETNLYLWDQEGALIRAQMEMAEASMVYEGDSIMFENKQTPGKETLLNNDQIAQKVYAIIHQMDSELPLFQDFKKIVEEHVAD